MKGELEVLPLLINGPINGDKALIHYIFLYRTEELERNSQLRTREMREKEMKNSARIYRFTLLRVRFPDQVILQGSYLCKERMDYSSKIRGG